LQLGEATHAALTSIYTLSNREQFGLLTFTSLVEMIMATQLVPMTSMSAYEISLGAISAFISLVCIALDFVGKPLHVELLQLVIAFVWLWWFIGAIVATFFGSFTTLVFANGFFFTWASFIIITIMLTTVSDRARSAGEAPSRFFSGKYSGVLYLLFLASTVEMAASINPCSVMQCTDYVAFSLALGIVSMFITLILLLVGSRINNAGMRGFAIVLTLLWLVGTGIVTFKTPFVTAGNGYFASFAATFFSIGLLRMSFYEE